MDAWHGTWHGPRSAVHVYVLEYTVYLHVYTHVPMGACVRARDEVACAMLPEWVAGCRGCVIVVACGWYGGVHQCADGVGQCLEASCGVRNKNLGRLVSKFVRNF